MTAREGAITSVDCLESPLYTLTLPTPSASSPPSFPRRRRRARRARRRPTTAHCSSSQRAIADHDEHPLFLSSSRLLIPVERSSHVLGRSPALPVHALYEQRSDPLFPRRMIGVVTSVSSLSLLCFNISFATEVGAVALASAGQRLWPP